MLTLDEMIEKALRGEDTDFGAAISPIDDRDYIQYPPAPGSPASFTVPGVGEVGVYSQQGGTCTGYAIAAVLSYLEFAESGKKVTFDGSEIHHRVVRSYEGGVWPRDVLSDVYKGGAEAQTTASASGLYFIGGFAGVPVDPDSIMTALSTTGPLVVVCWLGNAFMKQWGNRGPEYIAAPAAQDQMSLHSMLLVSGDKSKGAVIQNNWGVHGGVPFEGVPGGYHTVSWEWLHTQCVEAWALADKSNATTDGWIRNHENKATADGFTLVKRPDRPAVYAILGETRDWISSQKELYARGLGGIALETVHKSDPIWGYPVVGQDAPEGQRA